MSEHAVQDAFFVASDGLRLFYRDFAGPPDSMLAPVICLPGLTRNSLDFQSLALRLCARRRVLTTDLRGRGRSAHDPERSHYHPGQYVADVFELLDQLRIPRVVVIGTSLGGWMAMLMGFRRPGAVCAAIINDIGPEIDPAGLARVLASAGTLPPAADWGAAVAVVKQFYKIAWPDWHEARWLAFARDTYRVTADGSLNIMLDRNVGVASREGLSALRDDPWLLFDALRNIPSLVLRGALSDILSAEILEKMQKRNPDLVAVTVSNRGHAPYLDEPEALGAVETFLQRI